MNVDAPHAIVVCCTNCQRKNRVSDPFVEGRIWKCASCKHKLLHNFSRPGDRFLTKCIGELQVSLGQLHNIKSGVFAGKRLLEISDQVDKVKSKVEAWRQHLEYIAKDEERELAKRYHASDLLQIELLHSQIDSLINSKSWFKKILENSGGARRLLTNFSDLVAVAGGILTLFGIPNSLLDIAYQMGSYQKLIERKP